MLFKKLIWWNTLFGGLLGGLLNSLGYSWGELEFYIIFISVFILWFWLILILDDYLLKNQSEKKISDNE